MHKNMNRRYIRELLPMVKSYIWSQYKYKLRICLEYVGETYIYIIYVLGTYWRENMYDATILELLQRLVSKETGCSWHHGGLIQCPNRNNMLPRGLREAFNQAPIMPRGYKPLTWPMIKFRLGANFTRSRSAPHTEKYFRNLIKSNRNQIVFTIFRLAWNSKRQTDTANSKRPFAVPNQLENDNYNQILV